MGRTLMDKLIESVEDLKIVSPEAEDVFALSTNVTFIPEASTVLLPDQCFGCDRAQDTCSMYSGKEVAQHTRLGGCAGRSHNREVKKEDTFKLNPLKASKRGQKGVK